MTRCIACYSGCQDLYKAEKLSQTSFSLYQWTDFHKIDCAVKSQMRAICTFVEYTKATNN